MTVKMINEFCSIAFFTSMLELSVHKFEWTIKTNDTPHCIQLFLSHTHINGLLI